MYNIERSLMNIEFGYLDVLHASLFIINKMFNFGDVQDA